MDHLLVHMGGTAVLVCTARGQLSPKSNLITNINLQHLEKNIYQLVNRMVDLCMLKPRGGPHTCVS